MSCHLQSYSCALRASSAGDWCELFKSFSNPRRIAPAIQNCMDENGVLANLVEDSEGKSTGQEAIITLIGFAVNACVDA